MANLADQLHSRAQGAVAAKVDGAIQAAEQQFNVETKYVDVTIQVGCAVAFHFSKLDLRSRAVHRRVAPPQNGGHWDDRPVLPCEPGPEVILHARTSLFSNKSAESDGCSNTDRQ